MVRYNSTPDRIINLDETGINTVLLTPKVLAEKKEASKTNIVSAERGELSDSDSSQNEFVKLSDDNDEELEVPSDPEDGKNFDVPNSKNINIEDLLRIKFEKKKTVVYYVAKIIFKYNMTDYQVSCLVYSFFPL
ncbi:hypothetical protein ILUMI_11833 [Ignelater luminosus]|uniref:Uncharacterized protein n=1 Tax=Ignelater luminosus TaxID=2038154 RepID=A0A8K0D474_IGNLU|nr:hypothetical protein ILUMI_11833 [Ignelater luminosus]